MVAFTDAVQARQTDGNLAVVEGALARAFGLSAREAVLLELRGFTSGLLYAAIRLGRLSPFRAQALMYGLAPSIVDASGQSMRLPVDELRSTGPEAEIHALLHRRADARLFAT